MDKCKLTISKLYSNKSCVFIQVKDVDAGIKFLEIEIDFEEFAKCLMGQGEMKCLMKTNKIQNVGKTIKRDTLEFELPMDNYVMEKKDIIDLAKKNCPDGWDVYNYFGSKDSFFTKNNKPYARTQIKKWVKKEK